jgi:ABC-2 type transport system permease protein
MIRVVRQLLLMQWRGAIREPEVLFWGLVFPIMLSGLLGLAFTKKGAQALPVVLVAADAQEAGQAQSFLQSLDPKALLSFKVENEDEARLDLKRGHAVLAVFQAWDPAGRRFLFDPQNNEGELARYRALEAFAHENVANDSVALDAHGSRYIDFVLPGLFALSVVNSCLWGVGFTIIDYRQKRFLRRMVATPLKAWH